MPINYLKNILNPLKSYIQDNTGAMAMTWVLSFTALTSVIGAGFDYSLYSNAQFKSQAMADAVALSAAVYMSKNGRPPKNNDQGYVPEQIYSATDIGYDYAGNIKDVALKVTYNQYDKETQVLVTGRMIPAFIKFYGYKELRFKSESTVKYAEEVIKAPASIVLVLDNSGSMAFYDEPINDEGKTPIGAKPRIEGLQETVKGFMSELEAITGSQTVPGKRVLRTGMIPYSNGIITKKQIALKWGIISDKKIDNMHTLSTTNPNQAIKRANTWLKKEKEIHTKENGTKTSFNYVIFMTDGLNNSRDIDKATIQTCNTMKNLGVTIFTIGYALKPGKYVREKVFFTDEVDLNMANRAYDFLRQCGSPNSFFSAEDGEALKEAFEKIGSTITEDIIRLAG